MGSKPPEFGSRWSEKPPRPLNANRRTIVVPINVSGFSTHNPVKGSVPAIVEFSFIFSNNLPGCAANPSATLARSIPTSSRFLPASLLLQETALIQPIDEAVWPFRYRPRVGGAQTETVSHSRIDVQFGGHVGMLEFEIDGGESFGDVRAILVAAEEEGGR